eukprot:ANDGO_05530.mRNA.1 hypothetical protein
MALFHRLISEGMQHSPNFKRNRAALRNDKTVGSSSSSSSSSSAAAAAAPVSPLQSPSSSDRLPLSRFLELRNHPKQSEHENQADLPKFVKASEYRDALQSSTDWRTEPSIQICTHYTTYLPILYDMQGRHLNVHCTVKLMSCARWYHLENQQGANPRLMLQVAFADMPSVSFSANSYSNSQLFISVCPFFSLRRNSLVFSKDSSSISSLTLQGERVFSMHLSPENCCETETIHISEDGETKEQRYGVYNDVVVEWTKEPAFDLGAEQNPKWILQSIRFHIPCRRVIASLCDSLALQQPLPNASPMAEEQKVANIAV